VLECVLNISEGRDRRVLGALAAASGDHLLDVHSDPDHHRTVLTLGGPEIEDVVREVATRAVELVDLRAHCGAHPRLGVVDVVPFVPLDTTGVRAAPAASLDAALQARRRFAEWAGRALALPCFYYGPERSLPEVRRAAFSSLRPDTGPADAHPRAGASCVGARPAMIAYNVWLASEHLPVARRIAAAVRGPVVRALGLRVGGATQVSMNLLDPAAVGPAEVMEAVTAHAGQAGISVLRAELVGLAPSAVVEAVPATSRAALDLDLERTVEARLGQRR
jgi:glutamate formiminotransferase / 5-formyltetrahydrofolate cyclo-ligase